MPLRPWYLTPSATLLPSVVLPIVGCILDVPLYLSFGCAFIAMVAVTFMQDAAERRITERADRETYRAFILAHTPEQLAEHVDAWGGLTAPKTKEIDLPAANTVNVAPPKDATVRMWVITRNPSDVCGLQPGVDVWVTRERRLCVGGEWWVALDATVAATLEAARWSVLAQCPDASCLGRDPQDDPVIAEVWIG